MDSGGGQRDIGLMQFTVTVSHDEREGVWYVQSSDIPGLHVEAPTYDALMDVIIDVVPELIEANVPDAVARAGAIKAVG